MTDKKEDKPTITEEEYEEFKEELKDVIRVLDAQSQDATDLLTESQELRDQLEECKSKISQALTLDQEIRTAVSNAEKKLEELASKIDELLKVPCVRDALGPSAPPSETVIH